MRARGETWPVDPEMREAFDRLGVDLRGEIQALGTDLRHEIQALGTDLRGEIRTSVVEMRGYVDERLQTSTVEMRAYVDERLQTSTVEMRRHFEVVGESLRGDIRAVAEGVALLSQRVDRGFAEQAGQVGALDGRVLRLEVRVKNLEDDRKPRRPRRRQ
jgi:hypothetical protein